MPIVSSPESCTGCAKCCWLVVCLHEDDDILPEMVTTKERDTGEVDPVMKRGPDGFCIALDRETRLCTIYERRPMVCREFGPHQSNCFDAILKVDTGYVERHIAGKTGG